LVDPFIGAGEHGHTYPGATMPFGMVHLSPDTRMENWDGCSGYHYSDSTILGFSHIHMSGTGSPEFCDVLLMPTVGDVQIMPGDEDNTKTGYRSAFSHDNEEATAGYYKVLLDDYNVTAELTTTERTGLHRYTFPKSGNSNIIIDLKHRDSVIESNIQIVNDSVITGFRRSAGWCADQYVYFYAKFSKPFNKYGIAVNDTIEEGIAEAEGDNIKAFVSYGTETDEKVLVKVGISAVSVEGAKKNLYEENSGWDFAEIRENAKSAWNKQLSKIEVEGGTERDKRIFYTSMYHSALAPNIFMDVDGGFRGVDKKVHKTSEFTNYTIYSLWDVFRTQLPLFTIIEPSRTNDFIKTALSMYQIGGHLPRWEINGHLSNNMIGV
jgi:predicted alpha-1,2-mannosidase